MEEKERYEIHIYDDICVDLYDNGVLDKSINDTYKLEELLNQQSKRIKELGQENQQLKQQLTEKDEQIESYKHTIYIDMLNQEILELKVATQEQDKISFCIEKFQETKKSLRDKVCLMENDEHCYPQNAIHWQDVVAIIDNQIKKLKKEMN